MTPIEGEEPAKFQQPIQEMPVASEYENEEFTRPIHIVSEEIPRNVEEDSPIPKASAED